MTHKVHRIDDNVVELYIPETGQQSITVNGQEVVTRKGAEQSLGKVFNTLVESLKETDYEYEEFVHEQEGWEEEGISQFVLTRVYSNGDVDGIEYGDNRQELQELVKQD